MIQKDEGHYRVSGTAVIADARALLETGRSFLLAESGKDVTLDFSAVKEVDSSALSVIFGLVRVANRRGVALHLANPPASLLSLAGLYGVSDFLPLT